MIDQDQIDTAVGEGRSRFFILGDQVVDSERNVILRDGELVKLEPKVMEVFVYLLSAGGRTVSKQELMNQVWGVQVVDEAIQRAISLLRTALASEGRKLPLIETVARKGYRLQLPTGMPLPIPAAHRRATRLTGLLLSFAAGAVVALAASLLLTSPEKLAPVAPAAVPQNSTARPANAPLAPN